MNEERKTSGLRILGYGLTGSPIGGTISLPKEGGRTERGWSCCTVSPSVLLFLGHWTVCLRVRGGECEEVWNGGGGGGGRERAFSQSTAWGPEGSPVTAGGLERGVLAAGCVRWRADKQTDDDRMGAHRLATGPVKGQAGERPEHRRASTWSR